MRGIPQLCCRHDVCLSVCLQSLNVMRSGNLVVGVEDRNTAEVQVMLDPMPGFLSQRLPSILTQS
jgi:hypothetical protein